MENYNHAAEGSDNEQKTAEGLTPELKAKLEQIEVDSNKSINKKDRKIGPLIAAVVVLLAISAAAIAFTMMKKDVKPSIDPASPTNDTPVDLEITDAVKKSIYDKIALLNNRNLSVSEMDSFVASGDMMSTAYAYTYIPELYNTGLDAKQKLYTLLFILRHRENKFEPVTKDVYTEKAASKYYNTIVTSYKEFTENIKMLSADYVADRYFEFYGEKITNADTNEMCGGFDYDQSTGYYLAGLHDACGGMDMRTALIHIYNVSSDAEKYYIDMNAATLYTGYSEDNKIQNVCYVYDDVSKVFTDDGKFDKNAKKYKDCELNKDLTTDFKLTDTDKDAVAKYRFIFDKELHFVGTKKI